MTYNDLENSTESGQPYFLYEFVTQSATYRFNNSINTVTLDSVNWNPLSITHSEIKQSNEISKNSIKINFPNTGGLPDIFKGWSPDRVVTVTVRRGHFSTSETLVFWKGRISNAEVSEGIIELTCESIFTSLRRPGIRARYQRNCRHSLYGPGCGLNRANFETQGTISAYDNLVLTIPEAQTQANNWYLGGLIEFSDDSLRFITSHISDKITISRHSRFLTEAVLPVAIKLYPGCDRTITTCHNKFNNLDNQGGFRWIPAKNPFDGTSII